MFRVLEFRTILRTTIAESAGSLENGQLSVIIIIVTNLTLKVVCCVVVALIDDAI